MICPAFFPRGNYEQQRDPQNPELHVQPSALPQTIREFPLPRIDLSSSREKENVDSSSASSQILDVIHPNRANVPKSELQKLVAQMYKVSDDSTIFLFGFKTQFGGGKSSGFGLIYDTVAAAKCYEPRYRLLRVRFPLLYSWRELCTNALCSKDW